MKKLKLYQTKENPQQKLNDPSPLIEIKKRFIYSSKTYKKEKTLPTKANTTMTESSKEDKKERKENTIKKKYSKDTNKLDKSNLSLTFQDSKKFNKTIDVENVSVKKKKMKKHRHSTKVKNYSSQKHFGKLRGCKSSKINLMKNKTSANAYLLSEGNAESSNNIMLGTEDNFIKSLLSKYNEGIDNIINEDSEAFNNITNNGEFENNSLFGEENEITETNTITETIEMKKEITKKDNNNNNDISNKTNNNKTINVNLNSIKTKKNKIL